MKRLVLIISVLVSAGLFVGCGKDNEKDKTISDTTYYEYIAESILNSINDLWNQNIAGRPSGHTDLYVDGVYGGSVHIQGEGQNASDVNIDAFDFTYSFTNFKYYHSNKNIPTDGYIVLTGDIANKGSNGNDFYNATFKSNYLQVSGLVTYKDRERTINETGEIGITRKSDNGNNSVNGVVFDKKVSW